MPLSFVSRTWPGNSSGGGSGVVAQAPIASARLTNVTCVDARVRSILDLRGTLIADDRATRYAGLNRTTIAHPDDFTVSPDRVGVVCGR
jgi:hypothetical protein